jgi:hypothetical protein
MTNQSFLTRVLIKRIAIPLVCVLTLMSSFNAKAQDPVPFTLYNNSAYTDANIYVAVVGKINGNHVWLDVKNGSVHLMNRADNTVQGPVIGGNQGPGNNGRYANCFARLSEIPNKTITMPGIEGCRMLMSFNSQLFLYFFGASGDPSGYAAPNLANPTDPNQGIRYEVIELANVPNGMWANTTRVDSYQYPMGLEVWGNNGFYKKVGEYKTHAEILAKWQNTAPAAFAGCYDAAKGIIHFPTKTSSFPTNYFSSYIDAIWSKYTSGNLVFNAGEAGVWSGRVTNGVFRFTRASDGAVATINAKPSHIEALEGSGVFASGGQWDKVVQAQLCAAITRHALDLNVATGVTQDFGAVSRYYVTEPYNWYSKFWHQTDITVDGYSYGFCYDDVFDQSATINAGSPTRATVTIGGFAGLNPGTGGGVATVYKDCNYLGYSKGLNAGAYTLSQLNGLGILNDDISSLKVNAGYKVTLYENDNFTGAALVVTGDKSCLVADSWNDRATSLKVETNASSFTAVIQAEDYTYMAGIQTEATTDAGGGLNVAYIEAGDWMSYNITIPVAGTYRVIYRVASPNAGTTLRLEKDNGTTQLGSVTIPNTGGWQNWTNAGHNVTLPAGTYSVGIATATGGFNINYFTITSNLSARIAARVEQVAVAQKEASAVSVLPNPVTSQLFIRSNELVKTLHVYNISGQEVLKIKNPQSSISVQSLQAGVYFVVIDRQDGVTKKFRIVKQ